MVFTVEATIMEATTADMESMITEVMAVTKNFTIVMKTITGNF